MKTILLALAVSILVACGSSSGGSGTADAPVISSLSIESPVTPGVASTGQLQLSDSAGLSGLTLNFTVTGPNGLKTMFSSPVTLEGNATGETEAPLTFAFELDGTLAAGTYMVSVTVTDGSTASNALETSVVVK
jgi:hypothetical protein